MTSSQAWKSLERRVCRALGAERAGPRGRYGPDDDGKAPFSVEVKRQKRYSLTQKNLAQARRQSKADGRPWLLVMCEHGSPRPVAILDFWVLAEMAQLAGMIETPLEVEDEVAAVERTWNAAGYETGAGDAPTSRQEGTG